MTGYRKGAVQRRVIGHPLKQNQGRADQPFGDNEDQGKDSPKPDDVPLGISPKGPNDQPNDQYPGQPTAEPVGKFNDCFQLGRTGDHLAVTGRPMTPTAGPGTGRPHEIAPNNHQHMIDEHAPHIGGEAI